MKPVVRILFLLVLITVRTEAAERDIVRTFGVEPGCSLVIQTYHGSIHVAESDRPEIRVAVHLDIGADSERRADRLLRQLELNIAQAGNAVTVTARDPAETSVRFVWRADERVEPTYRLTVPRHCNVDLRTGAGTIIVGNLSGRLAAHTGGGDVFFRREEGSVSGSTANGDVVVSQCDGALTAQTERGTIRVGVVTGRCDLHDASGGIEVMEAKGPINARAVAGNIIVGLPKDFAGPADIVTSGGSIVARIDPAARCVVDATASFFGRVTSRLPLTQRAGGRRWRLVDARLNGGGGRVVLHAGGGDITLEPGASPFE